jgi:hypothetical protein
MYREIEQMGASLEINTDRQCIQNSITRSIYLENEEERLDRDLLLVLFLQRTLTYTAGTRNADHNFQIWNVQAPSSSIMTSAASTMIIIQGSVH